MHTVSEEGGLDTIKLSVNAYNRYIQDYSVNHCSSSLFSTSQLSNASFPFQWDC